MKKIFSILFATIFLVSFTATASAAENSTSINDTGIVAVDDGNQPINGEIPGPLSPVIQPRKQGQTTKVTQNSSTLQSNVLLKYFTNSWTRASSYVVSYNESWSYTFSGGITAGDAAIAKAQLGFTATCSSGYSVGTVIEADKTRDSKLVFRADRYKRDVTVKVTRRNGAYVSNTTRNGTIFTPRGNNYTYIRVLYR